ncbi:MAG: enoyl-CoA hydratase/isomerase family protein [Acidimicrobiia bacterium]|nr:enoyl-CoA hydratase/isomerase family protein [Acidimicrobiia bacterium]
MIVAEAAGTGVTLVTIDRQERRNAVDLDAVTALGDQLEAALAAGTRVVVLNGAGGHFCAGADLAGVEQDVFVGALNRTLGLLREPALVTMAAISGACLGAGTQFAVCCDLRVATSGASIGVPAAKLGLAVDHETIRRLAAFAGEGTARAMLLAADELDGTAAHRTGLVQRLGDLDAALAWAGSIAELAPLTIAAHKLGLERAGGRADDPDVDAARRRAWSSDDLQEGLAAFRERRPPHFRGT